MNLDHIDGCLYGSNLLPACIDINGVAYQLGTVVARAHARSHLTIDEWNAMPESGREDILMAEIKIMRAQK